MLTPKLLPEEIYQKREEFGLTNSIKLLTEIIDTEKDHSKRRGAIKYLGLVSKETSEMKTECYETLENILLSEDGVEIKCEAAKALGKLQSEKALTPLKWTLEQESVSSDVKLAALKAIKKIKFETEEINLFLDELGSESNSMKEYVKNQLLSLSPEVIISLSLNALKRENFSNPHKSEVVKLIGHVLSSIYVSFEDISYLEVKYPEVVSELNDFKDVILGEITRILQVDDENLLNSVITILKIMGSNVENDIIKLLLNDDFIVKKNAIILTGKLRLDNAVDLLVHNLDNIYNEVSIASIEALGEIGNTSAVSELLDVLNIEDIGFEYTDIDMKFQIIEAVKKIYINNKDNSYDHLYSYLKRGNDTIKESVAFILGEIGKEEFVAPLSDLLTVMNLDVRKNTIIALGKIGSVVPIEALISILEDEDTYWLIKKVAVDAIFNIFQRNWYRIKDHDVELGRFLNKEIAKLIDHLRVNDDENFKVKLSLIKFLETYGQEKALDALIKRVNDFHRVVRIHASNAIKKIEERMEIEDAN